MADGHSRPPRGRLLLTSPVSRVAGAPSWTPSRTSDTPGKPLSVHGWVPVLVSEMVSAIVPAAAPESATAARKADVRHVGAVAADGEDAAADDDGDVADDDEAEDDDEVDGAVT